MPFRLEPQDRDALDRHEQLATVTPCQPQGGTATARQAIEALGFAHFAAPPIED
jgi:hypothetical protein